MPVATRLWLGGLASCIVLVSCAGAAMAGEALRSRTVTLTYHASVAGVEAGKSVHIWLPVPPTNVDQKVDLISKDLPGEAHLGHGDPNNNLYFEAPARSDGSLGATVVYRVTRYEAIQERATFADGSDEKYLRPDLLVPVGGKPSELLTGKTLPREPMELGRVLYDVVADHMQYRKDKPGWGRGDAVWACTSGYGNCTDFHSLFISLARTQYLPAKFEMGVSIPEARGHGEVAGYHCWAKFKAGEQGWVPVDISEASQNPSKRNYCFGHLDENRVMFSTGRDLVLTPKQEGPPLNFFIDPYVEVGGSPYPANNVKRYITYEDQPPAAEKP